MSLYSDILLRMKATRSMRVAVGGIHIESSEFTSYVSGRDDFVTREGDDYLALYDDLDLEGIELVPLLHSRALPGGPVDPEFYSEWVDCFKSRLIEAASGQKLDGVLLHIHGALSTPSTNDAEGDLAVLVREIVGPDCIIAASMDLHGNVSDNLFDACDFLTCYRTAPHIDEPETRQRALSAMRESFCTGRKIKKAKIDVPILLPGEKTSTEVEPGRSLYKLTYQADDNPALLDTAIWMGFPWADQPRCHGVVVVTGWDVESVRTTAVKTAEAFWSCARSFEFVGPTASIEKAIGLALKSEARPYFLSDTGDNPGAGGYGDTTHLLLPLLEEYERSGSSLNVVFASIFDPITHQELESCLEGTRVRVTLGAGSGDESGRPLSREAQLVRRFSDPIGGPSVVLAIGNFHIIVNSHRTQYGTAEQFELAGFKLDEQDLVVVKMGYLEPDLAAAANGWTMVLSPGAVDQDLTRIDYTELRRPIFPLDEDTDFTAVLRMN